MGMRIPSRLLSVNRQSSLETCPDSLFSFHPSALSLPISLHGFWKTLVEGSGIRAAGIKIPDNFSHLVWYLENKQILFRLKKKKKDSYVKFAQNFPSELGLITEEQIRLSVEK